MSEMWKTLQAVLAMLGGFLGYFVGGFDSLIKVLLTMIIIDYITGVMCAIAEKKLSSEVGFKGICKKILIIILVGVANALDVYIIGVGSMLRTAVIFFYTSNEGVSIVENAARLGLPIPQKIKDALKQLHDKSEDADDEDDDNE